MEDFGLKALGLLLDKFGLSSLLLLAPAAACLWMLRINSALRQDLEKERAARIADLKQVLPVIEESTIATQSGAAALTKLDGTIQQLTLAQLVHGGGPS